MASARPASIGLHIAHAMGSLGRPFTYARGQQLSETQLAVLAKQDIRRRIAKEFGYDLARTVEQIRPTYTFDVSCQGSVPEAIIAFLDSTSIEGAIRLAISLGGDADTQAAIAGGVAEAHYGGVSAEIATFVRGRLPGDFLEIIDEFQRRYPVVKSLSA